MRKSYILSVVLFVFAMNAFAQQDAQFTLFQWATPYYNAGAIGEQSNTLCFTGIFRQQYTGWNDYGTVDENGNQQKFNTSPQQIYVSMESYLRKLHGSLGVSFIKDKIGYFNNVGVKLGYSFKLRIPTGSLGIGLQAQLLSQKLDPTHFNPIHTDDALINGMDQKTESWLDLDFNFGLFYKADRWNAGLGVTQIAEKLRLSGDKQSFKMSRNLYIHGGYTWILPWDPSWEILPQALIKTDLATAQFDLMVLARYNGILWFGASYRIQDAVSVLFGARPFFNSSNNYLKGLEMGLGYSFTTSKLGYKVDRSYGDIEIMLRYCFDIYKEEVFSGYGSTRAIYKNQY